MLIRDGEYECGFLQYRDMCDEAKDGNYIYINSPKEIS